MKRRDLMKKLKEMAKSQGHELITVEGANHTKVTIGKMQSVVARHGEINEITAKAIIKQLTSEGE